jgi:hypothetical protein
MPHHPKKRAGNSSLPPGIIHHALHCLEFLQTQNFSLIEIKTKRYNDEPPILIYDFAGVSLHQLRRA